MVAITKCELANFWAFASLIIELHRKTKRKLCKLKKKEKQEHCPKKQAENKRQQNGFSIHFWPPLLPHVAAFLCCPLI